VKQRYTIASDDSGHDYVIPVERLADWYVFIDDEDACDTPDWAKRIDGGRLTFTDWKIG
jgi:hypothetical protein